MYTGGAEQRRVSGSGVEGVATHGEALQRGPRRRRSFRALAPAGVALVALLLISACARAAPAAAPAAPPAAQPSAAAAGEGAPPSPPSIIEASAPQGNRPTVKLAFSSSPGFTDLPMLVALERMTAMGYGTESVNFHASEIAIESTSKNDTQIGGGSTFTVFTADSKGAKLKLTSLRNSNEWVIASTNDITRCSDLQGKRLAIHSEGAVSTAMLKVWLKDNCPQTQPTNLVISGSDNRAAALAAGQIDASPLELASMIDLELKFPGKYRRLADFSSGLPQLADSGVYVNGDFLANNRAAVVDFVTQQVQVHRDAKQNPQLLKDAVQKYTPALAANADAIIKGYETINGFDVNGGLTPEKVSYTLDFFVTAGLLRPGLTSEQVSDLSILNEVLAKVGRQ